MAWCRQDGTFYWQDLSCCFDLLHQLLLQLLEKSDLLSQPALTAAQLLLGSLFSAAAQAETAAFL